MPRMPNNITTPASVAARLTDEEILRLAEMCFYEDSSVEEDQQTAAVLRDYVRMRSEIAELRECLRLSSNSMEMVVQWLGKYPTWQEGLKNDVARNRKVLEAIGGGK